MAANSQSTTKNIDARNRVWRSGNQPFVFVVGTDCGIASVPCIHIKPTAVAFGRPTGRRSIAAGSAKNHVGISGRLREMKQTGSSSPASDSGCRTDCSRRKCQCSSRCSHPARDKFRHHWRSTEVFRAAIHQLGTKGMLIGMDAGDRTASVNMRKIQECIGRGASCRLAKQPVIRHL